MRRIAPRAFYVLLAFASLGFMTSSARAGGYYYADGFNSSCGQCGIVTYSSSCCRRGYSYYRGDYYSGYYAPYRYSYYARPYYRAPYRYEIGSDVCRRVRVADGRGGWVWGVSCY